MKFILFFLAALIQARLYLTEESSTEGCYWTKCLSVPQCKEGFTEKSWEDCNWDEYMSFKKSYCCPKLVTLEDQL
ncbi:hypothetical protein L596_025375 [Steinernema carpocapsae]|uniref:Uncharacterized protein n=1 Tax=Steinernema carpocapsae TaxID=34508 RepID=A0A4U5M7L1_STECR|nr:hypothetical protein L596_025375 [Steinernema carpocapsae]